MYKRTFTPFIFVLSLLLLGAGCTADTVVNPDVEALADDDDPPDESAAKSSNSGACKTNEAPSVGAFSGELLIRACDTVDPYNSRLAVERVRVKRIVDGYTYSRNSYATSCSGNSNINWAAGLDRTPGCMTNRVNKGRTYLIYITSDTGSDRFIARWPRSAPPNPDVIAQWADGRFTDVNGPSSNWYIDNNSVPSAGSFKVKSGDFRIQLIPGGGSRPVLVTSTQTYILDFSPILSLVDGHTASGNRIQVGGTISGNTIKVYDWKQI